MGPIGSISVSALVVPSVAVLLPPPETGLSAPTPVFVPDFNWVPPSPLSTPQPASPDNLRANFVRKISMQFKMDARRHIPTTHLTYKLPSGGKLLIDWVARDRELLVEIQIKKTEDALNNAWKKLTAPDGTVNGLLQTIGRQLSSVDTHFYSAEVTWIALHDDERPWTLFQLRHRHFNDSQGISLSLKAPEQTEPMQWIRACLEGFFVS